MCRIQWKLNRAAEEAIWPWPTQPVAECDKSPYRARVPPSSSVLSLGGCCIWAVGFTLLQVVNAAFFSERVIRLWLLKQCYADSVSYHQQGWCKVKTEKKASKILLLKICLVWDLACKWQREAHCNNFICKEKTFCYRGVFFTSPLFSYSVIKHSRRKYGPCYWTVCRH